MSAVELERRASIADPVRAWERMTEIRLFEDRIVELFAEGRIHGTTHTCQGQEAVSVGIARAARPTDHVSCTYRSHGIALALGMHPDAVLGEITGRESGAIGGVGGSMHLSSRSIGLLPTSAIVGAGIPIAAGAALAAQVLGSDDCAIGIFGDGAANIGAFHEGLNLAAVWRLPVVFCCENNLYGEYSRIDRTTPVGDLAVRAAAYAMPGEVVDGQDLEAVTDAVQRALDRARAGEGPTLLEMKTYRFVGHSRADAATYRPAGELDDWRRRDPITVLLERLVTAGQLDAASAEERHGAIGAAVESCVERTMAAPLAPVERMFTHVRARR